MPRARLKPPSCPARGSFGERPPRGLPASGGQWRRRASAGLAEHFVGHVPLAQALVAEGEAVARGGGPGLVAKLLPQGQGVAVEVQGPLVLAQDLRMVRAFARGVGVG